MIVGEVDVRSMSIQCGSLGASSFVCCSGKSLRRPFTTPALRPARHTQCRNAHLHPSLTARRLPRLAIGSKLGVIGGGDDERLDYAGSGSNYVMKCAFSWLHRLSALNEARGVEVVDNSIIQASERDVRFVTFKTIRLERNYNKLDILDP